MKTLLRIDCSARIKGSHSRSLTNYFETQWKKVHPEGTVVSRDLTKKQVPHIQNNTIEGFYTSLEDFTSQTKAATSLSDELIEELIHADDIVISSPLYNLNIPSNLKAYLDHVVRVGHTFGINANGYYGMLQGKQAYLILAKGGNYKGTVMEKLDFQEPYLQAILEHIGIRTQEIFSIEGTANHESQAQNEITTKEKIDESLQII